MARLRVTLQNLNLYEDEEAGSTHMAMYAGIVDSRSNVLVDFAWNNNGQVVDDPNQYSLGSEPGNPNTFDIEVSDAVTIDVSGFADDDNAWPSASSNENSLGSASVTINPNNPNTLGNFVMGPTTTDNGSTGFDVRVEAETVPETPPTQVQIEFVDLLLTEDFRGG